MSWSTFALDACGGASVKKTSDGVLELVTPSENWSLAALASFSQDELYLEAAVGLRIHVDLELVSGTLGIFVADTKYVALQKELIITDGGRQQISLVCADRIPNHLCLRSTDSGSARARIFCVRAIPMRRVNIAPVIADVLPAMLRSPGGPALEAIAQSLSIRTGDHVSVDQIAALEMRGLDYPIGLPPLSSVFDDPIGDLVIAETRRLTDLLPSYQAEKLIPHVGCLSREYFKGYLRQNIIRVYSLVRLLHELGLKGGSILEIGTLMGSFSSVLRRLGYDVTAVDRYRIYDGALDGYVSYMRSIGIHVVETDRDDEASIIGSLGDFDGVISMAVIEHIPHTPRFFLQTLASHLKPDGILALDTPNIARYWNRRALSEGRSVHQDIDVQFNCEIPYEGHHREYTADEMIWMMQQVGCRDVQVRRFDYNILQFDRLWWPHDECLLTMNTDPTQTDTILVAGRR